MSSRKPVSYDRKFFDRLAGESLPSAREIVPIVLELTGARSCVDVGCGEGAWLSIFKEHGLSILGCDGEYVDRKSLLIPEECFHAVNLNKPFKVERKFDLCVSLKVAEHLDPAAGPAFISSLVELAPCVLFSAAVPHQGGRGHINERWPDYWAKVFSQHGYHWLDPIRPRLWNNHNVEWWFRQNIFLFCADDFLRKRPVLASFRASEADLMLLQPQIFHDTVLAYSHPKVVFRRAWHSGWQHLRRYLRLGTGA